MKCYTGFMGLFIRQQENRSQLQERLAADLREKAKQQTDLTATPDQTKDSRYVKDTEQTSPHAWIGIVVVIVAIAGFVVFVVTR